MELVDHVRPNMPIAIASGAVMSDITLILNRLDCLSAFEVIVTADHVAHSKPNPQTYALAVEQLAAKHPELNLAPADCLAIEDTEAGIASAKAAGLRTLAVATTNQVHQLRSADQAVESLEGLTLARLHAWFDGVLK